MNIGSLRHRVLFQRPTSTQNDFGEAIPAWSDIGCATWARVEPLAGKERFAAMQTQTDTDYRILCRYQSDFADLAPDDRVTWGSLVFDIRSVINTDQRNIELQIFAKLHS